MLLRGSGQHRDEDYGLDGIVGGDGEASGVDHAAALIDFAEAYFEGGGRLAEVRARIVAGLGAEAAIDAAGVVAIFNAVVRIADATGIPLEAYKAELSAELRANLGIDGFPSAKPTPAGAAARERDA